MHLIKCGQELKSYFICCAYQMAAAFKRYRRQSTHKIHSCRTFFKQQLESLRRKRSALLKQMRSQLLNRLQRTRESYRAGICKCQRFVAQRRAAIKRYRQHIYSLQTACRTFSKQRLESLRRKRSAWLKQMRSQLLNRLQQTRKSYRAGICKCQRAVAQRRAAFKRYRQHIYSLPTACRTFFKQRLESLRRKRSFCPKQMRSQLLNRLQRTREVYSAGICKCQCFVAQRRAAFKRYRQHIHTFFRQRLERLRCKYSIWLKHKQWSLSKKREEYLELKHILQNRLGYFKKTSCANKEAFFRYIRRRTWDVKRHLKALYLYHSQKIKAHLTASKRLISTTLRSIVLIRNTMLRRVVKIRQFSRSQIRFYRNKLKTRGVDREASQNAHLKQAILEQAQGANFKEKPTPSKTAFFSTYFQRLRQIAQKKRAIPKTAKKLEFANAGKFQLFGRFRYIIGLCCLAATALPIFFIWKQEPQPFFSKNSSADFFAMDTTLRSDKLLCLNDSHGWEGLSIHEEPAVDSLLFFQEVELPVPPVKIAQQESSTPFAINDKLFASASSESLLTSSSTKSQPVSSQQTISDPIPQWLSLSNTQATDDGFGNVQSYWSLNMLLAPTFKVNHYMPFIDLRWNTFNDCQESNKFSGNLGIGVRHIPQNCGPIWGGNIYYNYRDSSVGKGWNQLGLGLEVFGKIWEFRTNIYLPIGNKLHEHKCKFDDFNGDFTMVQRKFEFMYTGFDTEIGCLAVATQDYTVYIGTGPYYLNGKFADQAWGIRVRFRPQYKDYIALDVMMTHDSAFNTVYQGELILALPFYALGSQKDKKPPCGIMQRQIYQPVQRLDVIPVGRKCRWSQNF